MNVVCAAAVAAALLVLTGCARGDTGGDAQWQATPVGDASALAAPAAVESSAPAPTPTPSPTPKSAGAATPKPTPTAKKPPAVQPSRDPVKAAQPLPPPPHRAGPRPTSPAPGASCPSYTGTNAAKADLRAALDAAAEKRFWYNSAPSIRIPSNLLYATAWQESGWQSAILACDGGIGTMQVMPDTATWMNNRFDTSYDVHTVTGNVMIGTEYLAWLVKYFGDAYFQSNYDLSVPAAPSSVSLLDSVISAYNYGPGAVTPDKGRSGIPNWQYVTNVEALMTDCPCLRS
jgi:soluble lytic murein transglycosylase-like protein